MSRNIFFYWKSGNIWKILKIFEIDIEKIIDLKIYVFINKYIEHNNNNNKII